MQISLESRNQVLFGGAYYSLSYAVRIGRLEANKLNIETARRIFLWCTVINYSVLLLWSAVFLFAHDWHYGLTTYWFRGVSAAQYDLVMFGGIAFFKILVILFNLVPYLALSIVKPRPK